MNTKQRTIKERAAYSGVGLHTGNRCTVTFCPAEEGTGLRFKRTDLPGSPEIPALVSHVADTPRGTNLALGDARVHTVEHILAACVGLEIDNAVIELDNDEPPIGDGSASVYVSALQKAGMAEQNADREFVVVEQTVRYIDEARGVDLVALPMEDYRLTVMIDYNNPALGSQHTGLFSLEKEFVTEFAPARTFCFLHEVEELKKAGLIKGGTLDSAIVIVDREIKKEELKKLVKELGIGDGNVSVSKHGVMTTRPLRYPNEPARHKTLDLMGDLALVGVPIKAQILAARPGHAANVELARKLRKLYEQQRTVRRYQPKSTGEYVMDINAIMKMMPHRYPFLLVDRVLSYHENTVTTLKNVTINEHFFQGHFPSMPVMPGVLLVEAMAQSGALLIFQQLENPEGAIAFFTTISNCKFRKPVVPGDQIIFEITQTNRRGPMFWFSGKALVNNILVAEAEFAATLAK